MNVFWGFIILLTVLVAYFLTPLLMLGLWYGIMTLSDAMGYANG